MHSFPAKRNGGARVVSAGVDDNAVGRQGRGCRTCSGRHSPTAHTRKLEKTEHVHPVKAAKTVLQEGVIAAKKG